MLKQGEIFFMSVDLTLTQRIAAIGTGVVAIGAVIASIAYLRKSLRFSLCFTAIFCLLC